MPTPRRYGPLRAGHSGLWPLKLQDTPERSPSPRPGQRNGHAAGYGTLRADDDNDTRDMRSMARAHSYFHLQGLVDDRGGTLEAYRIDPNSEKYKQSSKKVRHFYDDQNELLDSFAEVDTIIDDCVVDPNRDIESAPLLPKNINTPNVQSRETKIMVIVNFVVNVILLAAKIIVALLSGSISVIASTVDSAMDFLSTLIIFVSNWLSETNHDDWKGDWEWPAGRRRMEPMGVVIFSVAMIASFVQVFIESIQRLREQQTEAVELGVAAIVIMLVTVAIKLVMWLWCRRAASSSVQALAQDAENDVTFNIGSLLFPLIGQYFKLPWLDAVGGALLSLYIIKEWMGTLMVNTRNLLGKRASPAEHQRVCYLITRFSPLVRGVQHVEVYTAGEDFIVESDIILPATTSLPREYVFSRRLAPLKPPKVSHNVAESIQLALESLSGVSRAYVHLDFQTNPSSHQKK